MSEPINGPADPILCGDMYGYVLPDCATPVDPCSPDGATSLYYAQPCDGTQPPMDVWCRTYVGHPMCGQVPPLPATGLEVAALAGVGAGLLVAGLVALLLARGGA